MLDKNCREKGVTLMRRREKSVPLLS